MTIALTPVQSQLIAALGHNPDTNTMAVQFNARGAPGPVYNYANVDAELFDRLRNADSIGRFFQAEIKPHADAFPYTRVDQEA
jgi:hypothetical protein